MANYKLQQLMPKINNDENNNTGEPSEMVIIIIIIIIILIVSRYFHKQNHRNTTPNVYHISAHTRCSRARSCNAHGYTTPE
jgi:hypothetical protein